MSRPPKVTKEQALKIRELYSSRKITVIARLSERYGTSHWTVTRILKGTHIHTEGMEDLTK